MQKAQFDLPASDVFDDPEVESTQNNDNKEAECFIVDE